MANPSFDPKALDGLYDRPGFMLRRCLQVTGSIFQDGCRDLGLTPNQYDVLHILNCVGEINQDELARALGLDRATTGAIAATLVRKGLMERRVKKTDRRKRALNITENGAAAFAAAESAAVAARNVLFASLSADEKDLFMALLGKIVAAASPHARAPLQTDWPAQAGQTD